MLPPNVGSQVTVGPPPPPALTGVLNAPSPTARTISNAVEGKIFLLTMTLFLLVSTKVLGRTRWRTAAVLAVIGSVTAQWVFGRLLQINLPGGLVSF